MQNFQFIEEEKKHHMNKREENFFPPAKMLTLSIP